MKLWQKNYELDNRIERYTIGEDPESDLMLARYDVLASIAHAQMLKETGLLNEEEWKAIKRELKEILLMVENGMFNIDPGMEDVHSQVEFLLTENLGEAGKKLHTGRSRNDQVLVDLRLYLRDELITMAGIAEKFCETLLGLGEKYKDIFMPGYTHMQAAMPSSFGLWFGAWAEGLADDLTLLQSVYEIINRNPLGSAAGYGTSLPVNRERTTELLGFESMNYSSVYAQSVRGKTEKLVAMSLAQIADTAGTLSSETVLFMGQDFNFFRFPDEFTTGSSIMPHKKNPDVLEIARGLCNQIKALPAEIQLITNNLPSGYHRDKQLLKNRLFWSIEKLKDTLGVLDYVFGKIEVNAKLSESEKYVYLYSVEAVNDLVGKGIPFREAYHTVAQKIESGNFSRPSKVSYTHTGSIGEPGLKQIRERLGRQMIPFKNQKELIRQKMEILVK